MALAQDLLGGIRDMKILRHLWGFVHYVVHYRSNSKQLAIANTARLNKRPLKKRPSRGKNNQRGRLVLTHVEPSSAPSELDVDPPSQAAA